MTLPGLVLVALSAFGQSQRDQVRANVLMMVVDDLRPRFGAVYNDTEVYEYEPVSCRIHTSHKSAKSRYSDYGARSSVLYWQISGR